MKVKIVNRADDGEPHDSLPQYVYLSVEIMIDGIHEGSLSGYFEPKLHAFIKDALTSYAAAQYDGAPYCSYGHKTKASCDCGPIADNE